MLSMTVVRVLGTEQAPGVDKETHEDQELAGLFGASEVKRTSLAMVEAAFDGWVRVSKRRASSIMIVDTYCRPAYVGSSSKQPCSEMYLV